MFIVLLLAAFAAGLLALWWAKKTVLIGIKQGQDKFATATKVAFWSTIGIYIGSLAGILIAGIYDSTAGICSVFRVAQSGECISSFRGFRNIDYVEQYVWPLLFYFAIPFFAKTWASIALGLHIDALWPFIYRKNSSVERSESSTSIAPVVLTASVSFLLFNLLLKSNSHFYAMCSLWNAVCFSGVQTDFFPFDSAITVLGRLLDPWLNLPYVLESSLGNQFMLDNLYPLIALIFGMRMLSEERRPSR
jgi:hypothetical protein